MNLFTVLIAEKEHINAIKHNNKLFFEPFLVNKDLAFCEWNPMGQTLNEAVPGLLDVVGRKKEWRTIIINSTDSLLTKKKNPFDVIDRSSLKTIKRPSEQYHRDDNLDEWTSKWDKYFNDIIEEKEIKYRNALEYPLQKLSTWLCFKPELYIHNDIKEKQDVDDWAMEMIGRDNENSSVKLEKMEREHFRNELRLKENIRLEFINNHYLNISYPKEVYCISLRTLDGNQFNPEEFWNIKDDTQYSTFTDCNMYFDKMRFMVFDILSKTHRNYRSDYIRFLASLLIFASNQIPSSSMKSRKVYQLDSEADEEPLYTLVTSFDRKLTTTIDNIDNEIDKIKSEYPSKLTDKAAEELFCSPQNVSVISDNYYDSNQTFAKKDYGLFFDFPRNEKYKWNEDYTQSSQALRYIIKQRLRTIRKSILQMHILSEVSSTDVNRLTPLQIEDIKEFTENQENLMVESIPPDLTDINTYLNSMKESSKNVDEKIDTRMTVKTVMILTILCIMIYLLCFVPFIVGNNTDSKMLITVLSLSLLALAILALVLFIALFIMRLTVVNAVKEYNNTAKEIKDDVNLSVETLSKYLSATSNVRRGQKILNYVNKNLDSYTKSLRIRKKHQEDIRMKRAYLIEEYGDYIKDYTYCDETMSRPYEYDFDITTEYKYPAPFLIADGRQIEFISKGNYVTVPLSYITRVLVRMEGIYEE